MPDDEKMRMVEKLKEFGARVTTRQLHDKHIPYEINITFFDALKGTQHGVDKFQIDRFLQSQTIMLSLQGIPAFYFLNLFGVPNDEAGINKTGINRSINRKKFLWEELEELLDENSKHKLIFEELMRRTEIRTEMHAFSPETQQLVLDFGDHFFSILRKTDRMDDSVVCVYNLTNKSQEFIMPVGLMDFNTDILSDKIYDIEQITLEPYQSVWLVTKETD